jgi:hypothetical protein
MQIEIVGRISQQQTIAAGRGIRELARLQKNSGKGPWRKRKGIAQVLLPDGSTRLAEVHWYEAKGIGRREFKVKYFLGQA